MAWQNARGLPPRRGAAQRSTSASACGLRRVARSRVVFSVGCVPATRVAKQPLRKSRSPLANRATVRNCTTPPSVPTNPLMQKGCLSPIKNLPLMPIRSESALEDFWESPSLNLIVLRWSEQAVDTPGSMLTKSWKEFVSAKWQCPASPSEEVSRRGFI